MRLFLTLSLSLLSAGAAEILPPGHRPLPPGLHALRGATVFKSPTESIENATIMIRNGRIEAVGKDVVIPGESRVWDVAGLKIYPGLIDPYLTLKPSTNVLGFQSFGDDLPEPKASGINFFGVPGQEKDPGSPGPGYGLGQITPEKRMADSYTLDEKALKELREQGFTAGNIVPEKGVIRGSSAFVLLASESPNKMILKRDVFQHVGFEVNSARDDAFPRSLMGAIAAVRQAFFDAQNYTAKRSYFEQSSDEKYRPELNLALQALEPAASGKMPVVIEPGSVLMVDRAARIGRELGLHPIILSCGQEWRRPELAKETGASFIVPLQFPEVPKLPSDDDWSEVSLDNLRAWDWAPENIAVLRKQDLEVALTLYGLADRKNFRKNLRLALDRGLSEGDALAAMTTIPAKLCGLEKSLGTIEPGKLANLTIVEGSFFNPSDKIRDVWIEGQVYHINPEKKKTETAEKTESPDDKKKDEEKRKALSERLAHSPQEGRGPILSPKTLFIRGATIWTSGSEGKFVGDMVVVGGKISAVGKNLTAPADAEVIDGSGKHLTPGLIDCHSHAMIVGNVNEATIPSSAMVRIGDVVNSETRRINEELAGGLTTANLLHGSANPIGGQNCVIKLREGASPEEMKFKGAPAGIKFALGENVKQSNWGENRATRFPQSRMGVPTFFANRFTAARQYLREWAAYEKSKSEGKNLPPPRRDLELEAIGEIIKGDRLIHCHSYRQDEILMFLRTMESFNVRVATLQHVLEGYKIADEIAKHGAGASCFSDWWAYKFEVYDAIPYAGAIMHDRGVVVSFNSDSSDLSRRLYTEAAKAVKYGNVPEEEALKFVTINPAKQLRIDKFVGSLEPGKDADFVLWSKSPLDSTTVCLETWIDGKKYFDAEKSHERSKSLQEEREKLLAKAKKVAGVTKPEDTSKSAKEAFFNLPYELQYEREDRHCDSGI